MVRAINFVLDILVTITRLQRLARLASGRSDMADVKLPPEPKILTPAAERALAEAEQRHRESQDRSPPESRTPTPGTSDNEA